MTPLEDYYNIRAPLITISKMIGAEVWTSEKYLTPASYMLMAHMIIYNVCNGYTVLTQNSDPVKLMQVTIIFGIASQLIFKFFYAISKKYSIRKMFDTAEETIYERHSKGNKEEILILNKTVRYLGIIWKCLAVVYSSTLFVFGMWPVYVYYTKGQIVPLFLYEIPLIDFESTFGYLLHMFLHVDIYILGILGSILADYTFIFIVFHAVAYVDLFILHAKELSDLLVENSSTKDLKEISEKWKTDWYAAVCFLIVVFGEITIYFLVGNLIELKVDELYDSVVGLPWNLLDNMQQKEYGYLLARTQRPLILTLLGFAPLNFESYMTVLRALYQFFVMILQYVE
ncbi:hypothetical protein RP20_CCG019062 [Aedes albopictus]|nr:hypothetical protein RP20_CCG019062 [Aedes albopictus]